MGSLSAALSIHDFDLIKVLGQVLHFFPSDFVSFFFFKFYLIIYYK